MHLNMFPMLKKSDLLCNNMVSSIAVLILQNISYNLFSLLNANLY